MVDPSDPIHDTPAAKRRKIEDGDSRPAPAWTSDSGDDLQDEDFLAAEATIPTQPLSGQKRQHLQYDAGRSRSDLISQAITQPTQPLQPPAEILVGRSSPPPVTSSPQPRPRPPQRAPFSRPNGVLANAMAPPGTAFRRPPGTQPRPVVDLDSDEDPPIHYSSDEEGGTQGRSNIKPTSFTKGGRGLDSSPNQISESPRAPSRVGGGGAPTAFMNLLSGLSYKPGPTPATSGTTRSGDDMASAYGSTSRPPRPAQAATAPKGRPRDLGASAKTLEDILDPSLREKVKQVSRIVPNHSIQDVIDVLQRKKGHVQDAMTYLMDQEDEVLPSVDGLVSNSPAPARKGLAKAIRPDSSQPQPQPHRPSVKQQVTAPKQSIAERYSSRKDPVHQQPVVEISDDDAEVRPKRRLMQGRKPGARRSSSPPQVVPPPAAAAAPTKGKAPITITSDSEPEAVDDEVTDSEAEQEDDEGSGTDHDEKLLKFLNECSVRDLAELCAQPEETITQVLDKRPFRDLDSVRDISITSATKSGKKSRARPVGDKLVEDCSAMLRGYDAVDELVKSCEKLAEPVQKALKAWGVRETSEGELQLMNLDEAHDSGIGTPSSVSHAEDGARGASQGATKARGTFIRQPPNMNPEYTLKDYQLVGINWLNLLFTKETSCILADDMGLGKTCQVIAFLAYLQTQRVDGVHLIIVPGSTLENWLREFERFAPDLQVRPYYGSQAEREEVRYSLEQDFDQLDVIVTTYDMAVGPEDNKFLRKLGPFSVCVYDEAHALRNPKSNRYQQLVRIGADFKVLLTGTPLQNNLQELIAILAFIMPDMFQNKKDDLEYIFKHKASTKDTDAAALFSSERIGRARTMMTPFILRRKKHQVLDLPAKRCRVEYCDMTDSQADFYSSVISEAQDFYAQKATGGKVTAKASSNVIMSLRKAAIHPLLSRHIYDDRRIDRIVAVLQKSDEFGGNPPDKIRAYITGDAAQSLKGGDYGIHRFCLERPILGKFALKRQEWMDCGKVLRFKELVTAYAASGDRVLVFSQFTTAMDILEQVLETLAVKFVRLDGSTKMDLRQELIDTFYNDTEITVFMLSTRAGGAGINLAAANKVIIFDSGFNPQDDVQAENRAHRVGQTREVEVVRLVTRGTIEEQIHALGESKLALDERVAGDASAASEDKAREKVGEQLVEKMLVEKLQDTQGDVPPVDADAKESKGKNKARPRKAEGPAASGNTSQETVKRAGGDLREAFRVGLEEKGVKVKSKQAVL
jgi:SWI/SNF-related matrix-associated actin-dependent regulator 1 of chromatin subfamily A